MSLISELKDIFHTCGNDQPRLVEAIETLARQQGDNVFQETFRLLFDRDLEPQRAARYWREALVRWNSQINLEPGQKLLKAALFDYLQNIAGDRVGSVKDGLTGLFTPSYSRAHLEKLLAAKRNRINTSPLGILLVAIDHYREILERVSQVDTDRFIRQLARLLRRHIREMDSASWLEGGRFSVILPDANHSQTYAIAERIRCAIDAENFPGQKNLPGENLTVSLGMASYPQDGVLAVPLMRFAEEQLELALKKGNSTSPEGAERRREVRHKVCSMVEVECENGGEFKPAMAVDISRCGMAIGGELALKPGMPLTIRFKTPFWAAEQTVKGKVRQSSLLSYNRLPRYGLEFLHAENVPIPPFNEGLASL